MAYVRINKTDEELLAMRNAGMTNQDIANALGCTIHAVRNHIGPQPGKNWPDFKKRMTETPPESKIPVHDMDEAANGPSACLVVENRKIDLAGTYGNYSIDTKEQMIAIMTQQYQILLDYDDFRTLTSEMNAILNKLDNLKITPEMW